MQSPQVPHANNMIVIDSDGNTSVQGFTPSGVISEAPTAPPSTTCNKRQLLEDVGEDPSPNQPVKLPKLQEVNGVVQVTVPLHYSPTHSGQYIVLCDGNAGISVGGYQTVNFANMLIQKQVNFERIEDAGRYRVRLFFSSGKLANQFVDDTVLHKQLNITCRIPKMLVFRIGVIYGIPTNVSTQEILSNIESSAPIVSIRRLKKRILSEEGITSLVETRLIEITFEAQNLPEYVAVSKCRYPVQSKRRKIRFCELCLSYRHLPFQCKGKQKCRNCTLPFHGPNCTNPQKCAHCNVLNLGTRNVPNISSNKTLIMSLQ